MNLILILRLCRVCILMWCLVALFRGISPAQAGKRDFAEQVLDQPYTVGAITTQKIRRKGTNPGTEERDPLAAHRAAAGPVEALPDVDISPETQTAATGAGRKFARPRYLNVAVSPAQSGTDICGFGPWIGKVLDESALRRTQRPYRILTPQAKITRDFHPARINVFIDGEKRVLRVGCW